MKTNGKNEYACMHAGGLKDMREEALPPLTYSISALMMSALLAFPSKMEAGRRKEESNIRKEHNKRGKEIIKENSIRKACKEEEGRGSGGKEKRKNERMCAAD